MPTTNPEVRAALDLYSNLVGGEIGVVIHNQYRPLLTAATGEELLAKLTTAAPALFVGYAILSHRLSLLSEAAVAEMESDPEMVAAASLLTETMKGLRGEEFRAEEFE